MCFNGVQVFLGDSNKLEEGAVWAMNRVQKWVAAWAEGIHVCVFPPVEEIGSQLDRQEGLHSLRERNASGAYQVRTWDIANSSTEEIGFTLMGVMPWSEITLTDQVHTTVIENPDSLIV